MLACGRDLKVRCSDSGLGKRLGGCPWNSRVVLGTTVALRGFKAIWKY